MKKLVLGALALTCAVGVYAQGTVQFNNRLGGNITYVYFNSSVHDQIRGNGTGESLPGTTDWSTYTKLAGSGYMAVFMSAPGAGQPESSLVFATPTTTFRTGTAAGNIASGTATLANVAGDAAVATLAMFAWDNASGQYSSPTAAFTAWRAGLIAGGVSGTFDVLSIGGSVNTPPAPSGLKSFNIYVIPEPGTMALAGLGAAALMIFRRRK